MNGIAYANIGDYADHLLPNFYQRKKVETDLDYQAYVLWDFFFNREKLPTKGGNSLEWRMQRGHSGRATKIRPFMITPVNYVNLISKGIARWCHFEKKAVWNELLARDYTDETELIDYMDSRYLDCLKGMLQSLEEAAVNVPENSSDDLTPVGLPFIFPKLAVGVEDTIGGFNGTTSVYADGTTDTTVFNTNRNNVTQAKTFVATHSGVNTPYLDTLRRCQNRVRFIKPRDLQQYMTRTRNQWRYFTNQVDAEAYEALVNAGPDDRNGDANPFSGTLTFRGMDWVATPSMDSLADSPGYGVNFAKTFAWTHNFYWMKWREAKQQDDEFTYSKAIDAKFQFACVNEREGGWCMHTVRTN